jgi:hypothetical protein
VVADPGASIECRTLGGDALQARMALEGGRADAAIKALANKKLDAGQSDWGYPHYALEQTYHATAEMAALVGWDDARVGKRVQAIPDALAKVDAQRTQIFVKLHEASGKQTKVDGITATVLSVDCGPRASLAGRCSVKLNLQNGTSKPIRWDGYPGPHAYVAWEGSAPMGVSPKETVREDIAPAATSEITLLTADDRPGTVPAILGVCVEHCGVLKLR